MWFYVRFEANEKLLRFEHTAHNIISFLHAHFFLVFSFSVHRRFAVWWLYKTYFYVFFSSFGDIRRRLNHHVLLLNFLFTMLWCLVCKLNTCKNPYVFHLVIQMKVRFLCDVDQRLMLAFFFSLCRSFRFYKIEFLFSFWHFFPLFCIHRSYENWFRLATLMTVMVLQCTFYMHFVFSFQFLL